MEAKYRQGREIQFDLDFELVVFRQKQNMARTKEKPNYSRDCTVVNGVSYFFRLFSLLICETTDFNMLRSAK